MPISANALKEYQRLHILCAPLLAKAQLLKQGEQLAISQQQAMKLRNQVQNLIPAFEVESYLDPDAALKLDQLKKYSAMLYGPAYNYTKIANRDVALDPDALLELMDSVQGRIAQGPRAFPSLLHEIV